MGQCHCCGDEIEKGRRGYYCWKPECQKAAAAHRAKVRAEYVLGVREGRIKPVTQPPRKSQTGYGLEEETKPNGRYCQRCHKPLTGARRFNCIECEAFLSSRHVVDGNYLYGSDFNMQELREYARKPLPWERPSERQEKRVWDRLH